MLQLLHLRQCVAQEVTEFTSCFEDRNILFIYVTDYVNVTRAMDGCLARGATLARISDEVDFNFAREFMDSTSFTSNHVWIGKCS